MATPSAKSVDASLWWDSFSLLLTELENASLSSELPSSLVKKLNENHAWFLETVARFKPPNQTSRDALEARQVNVGSHQLTVQPELRDKALKVSSALCLDEVQSYILVKRSTDCNTIEADPLVFEPLHMVIYVSAGSKERHATRDEVQKLISDGLESRLIPVLEDLLSSSYPEHMDVDLFTLWAEETLIEENVVLDILFLAYYESFCTCDGKEWRKLRTVTLTFILFPSSVPSPSFKALDQLPPLFEHLAKAPESDSLVDNMSQIVETQLPLRVPGLEGLYIPSRTRGHVLKMVDANTALVQWE
ncbi:hypothetical protein RJ640_017198, partial [Escallonia rubra]